MERRTININGDAVVRRPLSSADDNFTTEILKDLISQGYNGDELLIKFAEQRANIKKAVGILIDEADEIAKKNKKRTKTKEIFGED